MRLKNPHQLPSFFVFIFCSVVQGISAQHNIRITAKVEQDHKTINLEQEITFFNNTNDTLKDYILNDWNNAYSAKNTPLAKRFSDEYVRSFHLAKENDRGRTEILYITDQNDRTLEFNRLEKKQDLIDVHLLNPIYPKQKFTIRIKYLVKIPNDKFTRFGFDNNGNLYLKNWFLVPARVENNKFIKNSNENLDDIANGAANYNITLDFPAGLNLYTDLDVLNKNENENLKTYSLEGKNRTDFTMVLETKPTFSNYKNNYSEVVCNLKDKRLNDIQKAVVIDRVVSYVTEHLGVSEQKKLLVTQTDYERNPFYGLNQLPSFISPFPDEFMYELKFLKTFTSSYLKAALKLNPRNESWILDGIQAYIMMKYIDDNYPKMKMMGSLSEYKLLKGYNIFKADFNDQYNYLYLLMARKNLDQAIGDSKSTFIKFNEQISGKYRSGLSINYLNSYLNHNIVPTTISEFIALNQKHQTQESDFENLLKSKTDKDIDWFFTTVVKTRQLIDFKFGKLKKESDTIKVTIKNKTRTNVPVSVYGIKNDSIVFKKWYENIAKDTIVTLPAKDVEKLAINYNKEIPEYNSRNNWKSVRGFLGNNRPIKFTFFRDLEDPDYNQIFYVPEFTYNLYDGISPGLSLNNKSILDKPFIFDITPTYSSNTNTLIGNAFVSVNQNIREDRLYNIRYTLGAGTYHYAPNAAYSKVTPSISFRFRDPDYRANKKESVNLRQILVYREKSLLNQNEKLNDYSVFNLRYSKSESEITRVYTLMSDVQIASQFGKLSGEVQYRKLFEDNRQINLRFYAGAFMYRSTKSEFFSFGVDRSTDYLYDFGLLGRSESTGLFSQQYIMAEGGFKSKFDTRFANEWLTTANASFNIWNWIEIYGDVGLIKNEYKSAKLLYDNGIRLNLVPDYFELYFPVYSNNGWEIAQDNYNQKIRFVITLSPKTLISLFTRKWL
ncbi:aminopeptidase [Flavobacterium sp. SM15]|uniref:aminopeptidase n=1 Tax=Flavobacterium sp. SM15 TaxID=2908005 RepID=UPI001EDC38BF|nr:aminopeptidase [Flavobacterium sp. SM15]MCG2612312.1 aminopeptidase [Flavobacterium sp. SM15]